MKQSKSHIAPLAFLMLILFVSPMTVKAVHHHSPLQVPAPSDPHGKIISAEAGTCPVCQFEFVTFIAFDNPEYTPYRVFSSLDYCDPTHGLKASSHSLCSLRAPPVN